MPAAAARPNRRPAASRGEPVAGVHALQRAGLAVIDLREATGHPDVHVILRDDADPVLAWVHGFSSKAAQRSAYDINGRPNRPYHFRMRFRTLAFLRGVASWQRTGSR